MLEERVKKVIANVFNLDISDISESTSPDSLKKWNSLGHMNLILALEEEFNITFNDEQVIEIRSYPLIVCIIKEVLTEKTNLCK